MSYGLLAAKGRLSMAGAPKDLLNLLRLVAALQMLYSYQFALTGLREPVLAAMQWHLLEKRSWHFKRCNGLAS